MVILNKLVVVVVVVACLGLSLTLIKERERVSGKVSNQRSARELVSGKLSKCLYIHSYTRTL